MSSIDWELSWRASKFLDMCRDNLYTNNFSDW